MKRIIAALLAFLMLLALSACGSKTPAESPTFDEPAPTVELERTPDPTPVPEAVVDPEEIEWGYQAISFLLSQASTKLLIMFMFLYITLYCGS